MLRLNGGNWKRYFSFPCAVYEYIKLADASSLKLILYLLNDESGYFDPEKAAKELGISRSEIDDAILFWRQLGVLCDDETSPSPVQQTPVNAPDTAKKGQPKLIMHASYSSKDIAMMLERDSDMKCLFTEAETTLGRILKHADHEMLLSLRDYFGFSDQSIILILEHCTELGKTSARYIESVARDLCDRDITEFLDVDAEFKRQKELRSFESTVMRALGLETKLTPRQTGYIKSWQGMGFEIEMISLARERCVDATNKLSFEYIDKILKTWAEKKIFTPDAVKSDVKPAQTPSQNNTSYDLDDFDKYTLGITGEGENQ